MLKDKIKMFTYGSLREGFFNYDKYLKGNVISKKIGKINNFKLYHMPYKGYPAILDGENEIIGEVFELSNYDEVMEAVDKMEGFLSEGNSKNEYNKELIEVTYDDGTKEVCYVYKYNKNIDNLFDKEAVYIQNGDWKNHMLNK